MRDQAVITDSLKVIRIQGKERERGEAYDLQDDEEERSNLTDERPILRGYASQALIAWATEIPEGEHGSVEPASLPELDAATEERLRALGYTP